MYVVLFGSSLFYVAFIFLWAIIATSGAIEWYFPISLLFFCFFCHPQICCDAWFLWDLCRKTLQIDGGKTIVRRVENAFLWFFWVPGIHVPFVLFIFLMIIYFLFCGAKTIKLQSNVSMDLISIKWTIKFQ